LALQSNLVFRLMTKTEVQNFEIASDAFSTFKVPCNLLYASTGTYGHP